MRHACGPRATTTWEWTTANNNAITDGSSHDSATPVHSGPADPFFCYRVLADRDLQAGEELTVDYRTLSYRGDGSSLSSRPLPAVGALGCRCECCGREVFR